jgi:5-methylcytosine-specific restriction endonuclease McrA
VKVATLNGWTLGYCANCDAPLDPREHPTLFCSEYCKDYAGDVRYFRARNRDGRAGEPDIAEVLVIRMAHLVAGGYDSKERHIDHETRIGVLEDNFGLCCACNRVPATEVDHIRGPGGERENLQGLCDPCHNKKTAQHFEPMTEEHMAVRDAFLARVRRKVPLRASDDDLAWKDTWRTLLAATRAWCATPKPAG